jgi:pimeloyl-ACP methyl ester carboxylesterase
MLNTITHGKDTDRAGLLIAHGLYGSGRNWGVIGKRLSDARQVTCVDMRNHGQSDWADTHSYFDLADDLANTLETLGPSDVLGHSMGGKAAMVLALTRPELVGRMVVADIAPVGYSHTQLQYIEAMRKVSFDGVERRSDVAERLIVDDAAIGAFLLQSVDIAHKKWLYNLDVLESDMDKIVGFPQIDGQFDGPTLFLTGADSDYVMPEHRAEIKRLFPKARFAKLTGAGHWLHAQKPREFEAAVRAFLDM